MTARLIAPDLVRPFHAVERDALGVAAALRARGVAAGDRVLVRADNAAELMSLLLGLMHLDTAVVLLDHRQTGAASQEVAARARARWAVVDEGAEPLEGNRTFRLTGIAEAARDDWGASGPVSLDAWRRRADALVTLSSGSTGEPKLVVRSGEAFLGNLARTARRLGYRADDVLMPLLPFSHQYGLSLLLLAWTTPCSLVVAPYARTLQALLLAGRAAVSVVDATPVTYSAIVEVLERRPETLAGLASVRMWCVGGAPLQPALAERFRSVAGLPLLDGYGSTELGNVALASPEAPLWCGPPLDGVDVRVVDDRGAGVPPGTVGEIQVRTPDALGGVLSPTGELEPVERPWFATNDLGTLDAGGNLRVLGRKRAVHRRGHTLYPEMIERKAEACGARLKVVAVDDDRRGSRLVLFVEDAGGAGARVWRDRITPLLPAYERPDEVVVVDRLPTTPTGKVDAEALARRVAPHPPGDGGRAGPRAVTPAAAAPFPERAAALRRVLRHLRDRPAAVTEALTQVANVAAVDYELQVTCEALAGALEEVRRHRPGRLSQLAVLMPSNILLYSYALHVLIPTLYVERVVLRPSRQVHDVTARLHTLLAEVHDLDVHLSAASQREFLRGPVADADAVVLTGSYDSAEEVHAQLRPEQLFLYFGQGINPFVVGAGADLDLAVDDAVRARLLNSGQDCLGPDVYYVHDRVADDFVDRLCKRLGELRYGDYADPAADYGPLCYSGALETAVAYLCEHRHAIVHGGHVDLTSAHVEPTVLLRPFDDRARPVELFSPVFNLVRYADTGRLRRRLRSGVFTERALAATVFGDEPELVDALSRHHTVTVNMSLLDVEDGNRPFGGYGQRANFLSLHGKRTAEPLLLSKAVAEHLSRAP